MKRVFLNGNFLEMHDSIDEMPIRAFQSYNRFLLVDAGIGSDVDSINQHISRMHRYIGKGDNDSLIRELTNYQQNLLNIIQGTSPEFMAFGALIHRMNGKDLNVSTDEEIKILLNDLSKKGLTVGKVRGFLDYVKKKWIRSSKSSSPRIAEDLKTMSISPN